MSGCAKASRPLMCGEKPHGVSKRIRLDQPSNSPEPTYCGHSQPQPWTPQLGGTRAYTGRRGRTGVRCESRHPSRARSALDLSRGSYSCSHRVGDRPATIGVGTKAVGHARDVALQMVEVAISKNLFAEILRMMSALRPTPVAPTGSKSASVTRSTRPSGRGHDGAGLVDRRASAHCGPRRP
jgi:hypothetical protein